MDLNGLRPSEIADKVEEAWDKGFDALRMSNHRIISRLVGNTFVVKEPQQLRVPWAEFDLSKLHLPKLTAAVGGAGYFGSNYPGSDYFQLPVWPSKISQ